MKVKLDDSSRQELVLYRIARAHETLREVDYLLKGGFYKFHCQDIHISFSGNSFLVICMYFDEDSLYLQPNPE